MKTERITSERLTLFLGGHVATRTVQAILASAGLTSKKGYPLQESVAAVVLHFKTRAEKVSVERAESSRRREDAEAEKAELQTAQLKDELVPADEARAFLRDWFTKAKQVIAGERQIPAQQRDGLVKKLKAIRVDE